MSAPPIAASLARARDRIPYCAVAHGAPAAGSLPAADLVGCPATLERTLEQVAALYGTRNRRVAASFLVLGYFWDIAVGALACYTLDQRVPDLDPAGISVGLGTGAVFRGDACWALPNDPAAAEPSVSVAEDAAALRERLLGPLLEQHAKPLFATLRSVAPLGLNAMHANFVDRVISALLWISQALGDPRFARDEAPRVVARLGPRTRAGVLPVAHAGCEGTYQLRAGCCLTYQIPGRERCDTCPLIPMPERLSRFQDRMERGAHTY